MESPVFDRKRLRSARSTARTPSTHHYETRFKNKPRRKYVEVDTDDSDFSVSPSPSPKKRVSQSEGKYKKMRIDESVTSSSDSSDSDLFVPIVVDQQKDGNIVEEDRQTTAEVKCSVNGAESESSCSSSNESLFTPINVESQKRKNESPYAKHNEENVKPKKRVRFLDEVTATAATEPTIVEAAVGSSVPQLDAEMVNPDASSSDDVHLSEVDLDNIDYKEVEEFLKLYFLQPRETQEVEVGAESEPGVGTSTLGSECLLNSDDEDVNDDFIDQMMADPSIERLFENDNYYPDVSLLDYAGENDNLREVNQQMDDLHVSMPSTSAPGPSRLIQQNNQGMNGNSPDSGITTDAGDSPPNASVGLDILTGFEDILTLGIGIDEGDIFSLLSL